MAHPGFSPLAALALIASAFLAQAQSNSPVFFTSNMFALSYIFGVETAKAINLRAAEVQSTPELARKYNPVETTSDT